MVRVIVRIEYYSNDLEMQYIKIILITTSSSTTTTTTTIIII